MGWLITLGILAAVLLIPFGGIAEYGEEGLKLWASAGPFRIRLLSGSSGEKKKKEPRPKAPKESKSRQAGEKPEEKGGSLKDFLPLIQVFRDFLGDFRRKLLVKELVLRITLAGEDPCDLAVNYGRACAVTAGLIPRLEQFFRIRKRDIRIGCDFEAEQTLVFARLHVTIALGRALGLAAVYGVRALRVFLNFKNLRKGGTAS